MSDLPLPRPFLKWAGGKTQLADALFERMPIKFNVYHEPFVGSGAIFFRLFREHKITHAVLSDLNTELIDTYLAIRDHVAEVISILSEFPHNEEFYYQLRSVDPKLISQSERAARMIFLNKTGYNGLYRVNRQGVFNVPFGRYTSPKTLDKENLISVSSALQNVEILNTSFETVVDRAKPGDWVYFDPPYVPLSQTAKFTSYHSSGFGFQDQKRLRDLCVELSQRNIYITLSNSDTDTIRTLYSSTRFEVDEVLASRAINCNGKKRGKITELVIANYPVNRAIQVRLLEQKAQYLVRTE